VLPGRRARGMLSGVIRNDADPEHNRIRRELFAPISSSIQRIQFLL
jgi:hypothetical protein